MGQCKDYLLKHFGLYLDAWATGGLGQHSACQLEALDLPEETLSKLQEMVGARPTDAKGAEAEGEAKDIDPRQAILAGIMSALRELQWLEQDRAQVCEIRTI